MKNGNRRYWNYDRIANISAQAARNYSFTCRKADPPTEKQLEYLAVLEQVATAAGIVCRLEFEAARKTKNGASATIKKMNYMLKQRGVIAD